MLIRLGLRKPDRAADAREVQKRLRAARAHDDEHDLAREILKKKLALAEAMNVGADGLACATCAIGKPDERGAYAGGDCCSGRAENVFSDDEVAALAQAGTRPRDLVAATGPAHDPGCAFRGPTGCSLAVAHRPTICVRYACQALQRQLHRSGRHVEGLAAELGLALDRFALARKEREDREWCETLLRSL